MKTTTQDRVNAVKARIDALQVWFAAKPYGWRETALPGQLEQWADREREQDYLIEKLAMLEGK